MNNVKKMLVDEVMDYLIVGSGLAVLPLSRKLAEEGKRILLAEAGTYMGYEICRYYRPWTRENFQNSTIADKWFPEAYCREQSIHGETPLHLDAIKLGFEDGLLASGVKLLYNIQLVSLHRENDCWYAVFGSKGGLQSVVSKHVVDCTENNITASLLQPEQLDYAFPPDMEEDVVYRSIEFSGVSAAFPTEIKLPEEFTMVKEHFVKVHRGAFSNNHVFVEIPLFIHGASIRSNQNDMRVEWEARKLSLAVCEYLVSFVDAFKGSQIALASGMVMRRMPFDPLEFLHAVEVFSQREANQVIVAEKCMCIGNKRHTTMIPAQLDGDTQLLGSADICVVGGGPSGATAAFTAAREGASVILLDFNDELGGAATSGSVRWHWFGFRRGFTRISDERTALWQTRLRWHKQRYHWGMDDEWAVEAKAMAYLELCVQAKVDVYLGCLGVDVLMEKNVVTGILVSTPYGGMKIHCKISVDATGDGDIAAYAGVEYQYGNSRDRFTMWAALSPFAAPSTYDGDYSTTVDVADLMDRTRFILSERRRSGMTGGYFINNTIPIPDKPFQSVDKGASLRPVDHAVYLAPRESRHIKGGYVMTLTDQLLQKRYRDTIMVAYSNNDPKGISIADIMNIGLLPPNLHIHVPYRCIVPQGVEGMLVTGRALSCTHDANCAVRMQDDMQMLGGAAGMAAALCIADGVFPRDLDVQKLQKKLIMLDAIGEDVIQDADDDGSYDIETAVESIKRGNGLSWEVQCLHEYTLEPMPTAIVCGADSQKTIPVLKMALAGMLKTSARLHISRLLVYHGCEDGLDDVLEEIGKELSDQGLMLREGETTWCKLPPDHNMMPETAYLFHVLAFCKSRRGIPVFQQLVDVLCTGERDYTSNRKGVFYFIQSVAYCAERLGFEEFIPLLQRLLELPEIHSSCRADLIEPSIFVERHAYLALMLNRALARCGSREGYLGLCSFLEDNRALLRCSAHDELCELTGVDYQYDTDQWNTFIQNLPEMMAAKQWTSKLV